MYYYSDGENEVGPFAIFKLKILRENGLIADGTLVRQSESLAWVPLRELIAEDEAEPAQTGLEPRLEPEIVTKELEQESEPGSQSDRATESEPRSAMEETADELLLQPNDDSVSEPVETTAPKTVAFETKSEQSYDPAYKHIPKEKSTSPDAEVQVVPKPRKGTDPAYKYIPKDQRISAEPEPVVASDTNGPKGWLSYPPTPWRRFAARILDTSVNGLLGLALFGIAFYAIAPASADSIYSILESEAIILLDVLVSGIMASLIGGALIGVSGFTVGKLIFGIKVVQKDGSTIGFGPGLMRDFEVWIKGMGLGIPLVALFTHWFSYKSLTENRTTSWDKNRYVVYHRPPGAAQYFLNVLGLVAILLVTGLLGVLAEM